MDDRSRELLIKCFCEARKTQAFLTKCLEVECSEEDKNLLLELVKDSVNTSNKIREFCEKH